VTRLLPTTTGGNGRLLTQVVSWLFFCQPTWYLKLRGVLSFLARQNLTRTNTWLVGISLQKFFPIQQWVERFKRQTISWKNFYLTQGKGVRKFWKLFWWSVASSDGCLWQLLEPFSLHLLKASNSLRKFREWKWIERISIDLQMFGAKIWLKLSPVCLCRDTFNWTETLHKLWL
jgi:hypothetical protein